MIEYLTINLFHFTTVKPDGIMYLQVKCWAWNPETPIYSSRLGFL